MSAEVLDRLLQDIQRLQEVVDGWEQQPRGVVEAFRKAIDALHKEALARMIRDLRQVPEALPALRALAEDPVIYTVLRHHELLKPSLQERVERALEKVRPALREHDGDVELVEINVPEVRIRLSGSCDGCPASSLTMSGGVEKAILEDCPEITKVTQVKGKGGPGSAVDFVSPFAQAHQQWEELLDVKQLPESEPLFQEFGEHSVILFRKGDRVTCFENACAHLGLPMEMGSVEQGVLICPHHGFEYALDSGECLTVPEIQLHAHAVRVQQGQVQVQWSQR